MGDRVPVKEWFREGKVGMEFSLYFKYAHTPSPRRTRLRFFVVMISLMVVLNKPAYLKVWLSNARKRRVKVSANGRGQARHALRSEIQSKDYCIARVPRTSLSSFLSVPSVNLLAHHDRSFG